MAIDPSDPWIKRNSLISPERLHALGVVSYYWNLSEIALKIVLTTVMRISPRALWPLIHEMGDVAICTAIKETAKQISISNDILEVLHNLLDVYEINRVNRNQLMHFVPGILEGGLNRMKGPRFDPLGQPFSSQLKDIRRVADEIGDMNDALFKLGWIISREYPIDSYIETPEDRLLQLPGKLPLPERLWTPPQPNPQGRKALSDKGQDQSQR